MGTKDGFGTYTWADASKFQGDWKDNKIDGKVTSFLVLYLVGNLFVAGRQELHGRMEGQQHAWIRSVYLGRRQAV